MKIAVIHAALSALEPVTEAFLAEDPSIQVRNFLNEELLAHAEEAVKAADR